MASPGSLTTHCASWTGDKVLAMQILENVPLSVSGINEISPIPLPLQD